MAFRIIKKYSPNLCFSTMRVKRTSRSYFTSLCRVLQYLIQIIGIGFCMSECGILQLFSSVRVSSYTLIRTCSRCN